MYRVVLVDDEPWVLKSLIGFIEWSSYGFTIQAAFTDPYDALAAIQADPPDVVFADIRMPGMSGLALCRACRDSGLPTLVVFATAYADFEYAREAIEQQVFAYVLKPFEQAQIATVVERLHKTLEDAALTRVYQALRSCILSSLTFGDDPSDMLAAVSDGLSGFFASGYSIAAVDAAPTLDLAALPAIYYCVPLYGARYILLFPSLEDAVRTLVGLPHHLFYAGVCSGEPGSVSACIRASLIALYSARFCEVPSHMMSFRDKPPTAVSAAAEDMLGAIRAQKWPAAENALLLLENSCMTRGIQLDQIMQIYHAVLACVQEMAQLTVPTDAFYPFQDIYHLFSAFPKVSMLCGHIRALLAAAHSSDSADAGDGNLLEILRYVQQHFQDSLTLEFLSAHFHISLSHLCRQFKKTARMTFTEYLLMCRMEKATALLLQTDRSIAEISEQSGYSDYFYFCKMFKKYTGFTPVGYRKDKKAHAFLS